MAIEEKKDNRELLAVTVWQKITYLVKADPKGNVHAVVKEPINRMAKLSEGVISDRLVEVKKASIEDLESAKPTMPGVKI
jgi:hypothetical protein